ncbi:hypothetical protein F5H01DRAFT_340640 [Linnemannia elongata]|nr:hypothetical protein F5H01DRAFT_340640 [Linnemannia elongata]
MFSYSSPSVNLLADSFFTFRSRLISPSPSVTLLTFFLSLPAIPSFPTLCLFWPCLPLLLLLFYVDTCKRNRLSFYVWGILDRYRVQNCLKAIKHKIQSCSSSPFVTPLLCTLSGPVQDFIHVSFSLMIYPQYAMSSSRVDILDFQMSSPFPMIT